ncbi:hypothetical protein CPB85DRAFT_1258686 [Mucidula mucida]|nr:hypothetical protein CPB85DRAFT_1258686 [Mucidula mucida]
MSLRGEADWSPPFLCALIAHAIHLSFLFETVLQDAGKPHAKYADNVEVIWICWLIQDSLDFRDLQEFEDNAAVGRYLMEEGVLRTLSQATAGDDGKRDVFISCCETDEEDIPAGSIRGVVNSLECRRLKLEIEASESWKALVDDLNLVEPVDKAAKGNEMP